MPWPFGSSGSSPSSSPPPGGDDSNDRDLDRDLDRDRQRDDRRKPPPAASWLEQPDWEHYKSAKNWLPTALVTVAALSTIALYRSYLRRIPSPAHIPPGMFRRRSLFGQVTSVGDGDNFHLFHTPGGRLAGWGWLRRVPSSKAELRGQTIPIRIAGIDAPEGAHFGRPAQPHAAEALAWLSAYLLGRRVRATIYKRDQYERVVATVTVRRPSAWFPVWRRDVGLEMLRRGLATTYEAKSGAEFGGREAQYRAAEAKAKAARRGLWAAKPEELESPREYKNRMAAGGGQDKEREKGKGKGKSGWWF